MNDMPPSSGFFLYGGWFEVAATRLIALHKNKGKSVAACLKSRTDYAQNPDKTEQGQLVSSYKCSPLTVDEEFMLTKRLYEQTTGRRQKSDGNRSQSLYLVLGNWRMPSRRLRE